jgi:hypothetical protein
MQKDETENSRRDAEKPGHDTGVTNNERHGQDRAGHDLHKTSDPAYETVVKLNAPYQETGKDTSQMAQLWKYSER